MRAPVIYEENKVKVLQRLKEGDVEYLDLSNWSYQDRFFAFLLGTRFFETCGASYPSPRKKEEVPVWFLLCCAVQMRMHTTAAHSRLPGLLKNGPILSRVRFNVGGVNGGFNHKNRTERTAPVDFDCVRKFFKDTDCTALREWYNRDVVKFYRHNRAFDKHGIFVLDQTHIVVPENKNYTDAVRLPVDEGGQRIDTKKLSEEQRKAVKYRPCYALSELLHVGKDEKSYVVAGYQWGGGSEDELPQGTRLVKDFVAAVGSGVMKVLIVDRGYIDGKFISMVRNEANADVVVPLRTDMDMYQAAVRMVQSKLWQGRWEPYRRYKKEDITYSEDVAHIENCGLWPECSVDVHLCIMRTSGSDGSVSYWVLASTFKPRHPKELFEYYELRTSIEERHRQLKSCWNIAAFSSPHASLVEAHVLFTLLTYTLVQLHLVKNHLVSLTAKTIDSLKREESIGKNAAIVYHGRYFAVFDMDEYTYIIADLQPYARERIKKWIERNRTMPHAPC